MGFSLDGTNFHWTIVPPSGSTTLTTANSNDLIVALVETRWSSAPSTPFATISDTAGLTWHWRGRNYVYYSKYTLYYCVDEFYAVAASPLSSDTITVTASNSSTTGIDFCVFGVAGSTKLSAPFDPNSNLMYGIQGNWAQATTTNPDDFIFGFMLQDDPATNFSDNYSTLIATNGNNMGAEYTIVSSTQSALALTYYGDGVTASNTIIGTADALTNDSGGVGPAAPFLNLYLDGKFVLTGNL